MLKHTKEAIDRKRAEGVILGRPKGRKSDRVKLTGREDEIKKLFDKGYSQIRAAKKLKVNRNTLAKFMRERMIGW